MEWSYGDYERPDAETECLVCIFATGSAGPVELKGEYYGGNIIQGTVEAYGCLLACGELFIGGPDLPLR